MASRRQVILYLGCLLRREIGHRRKDKQKICVLRHLFGRYEVQILDCYNNPTYVNGQTGSIYKQAIPLANAMRKQGEWNVYDIIYTAPTFKEDGSYRTHPTVTVIHNGVVLQNHTQIQGTTEWIGFPQVKKHGDGPIILQSHGDPSEPISFRNIWIREL